VYCALRFGDLGLFILLYLVDDFDLKIGNSTMPGLRNNERNRLLLCAFAICFKP